MKRVSVEQAFLWAQQFAAREWRLLLPVTLAFMALPPLLVDLLAPQAAQATTIPLSDFQSGKAQLPVMGLVIGLVVVIVGCIGQLAIVALGLVARISVREAIGVGIVRLGILVAAWIMICCIVMGVALVAAIALSLTPLNLPSQWGLMLALIMGLLVFLWIRLIPLGPLIVERHIGPVTALRRAWDMSKGTFGRLAGALLVYALGASIVVMAASSAFGAIIKIGATAVGQPEVGTVLANVLFRVIWAVGIAGLQVLIVGLYRQLTASKSGI